MPAEKIECRLSCQQLRGISQVHSDSDEGPDLSGCEEGYSEGGSQQEFSRPKEEGRGL